MGIVKRVLHYNCYTTRIDDYDIPNSYFKFKTKTIFLVFKTLRVLVYTLASDSDDSGK